MILVWGTVSSRLSSRVLEFSIEGIGLNCSNKHVFPSIEVVFHSTGGFLLASHVVSANTVLFWISCCCGHYCCLEVLQLVRICLLLFFHSSLYSSFWYYRTQSFGRRLPSLLEVNPPTHVSGVWHLQQQSVICSFQEATKDCGISV